MNAVQSKGEFATIRRVLYCWLPAAALLLGSPRPRDLDAEVPPGPPAEWARALPVLTPAFPYVRTRSREAASRPGPAVDTAVEPREATRANDGRLLGPSNLTQIVTVDITSHLPWTNPQTNLGALSPMSAIDPKDPGPQAERIYWLGLVPLLRLWFHPEQVSRNEAIAHLVELGEAALPATKAAQSEAALAFAVDAVRRLVGTAGSGSVKPIEGSSAYEQMMFKFVEHELTSAFPYDPKGGFCRKLDWLGEEVAPFVSAYTQHEYPFLRRNAVSALALFHHRAIADRWLLLATTSPDPVVRFRALALLPRAGYDNTNVAPLCAQLDKARDEIEATRLIRTLGDLRDPAACAAIVQYAKKNETSADVVMAALGALARIGSQGPEAKALAWVRQVRAQIRAGRYRAPQPHINDPVDHPDAEGFRAVVMDQLALGATARMAPADPKVEEEMLAWLEPRKDPNNPPRNPNNPPRVGAAKLARVGAVAQIDFLEALAGLGARGAEALEEIAADPLGNLSIRAYALRLLPSGRRSALAREWAAGKADHAGLRAAAVEALDASDDSQAAPLATALLESLGFGMRPLSNPQIRASVVIALRALAARGAIPKDRMVGFLEHIGGGKAIVDRDVEELRAMVRRLVDGAAAGLPEQAIRDRIVELVGFAYDRRANLNVTTAWKEQALAQIQGLLTAVRQRKSDANYLTTVGNSIESVFAAIMAPATTNQGYDLAGDVPLEEIAILMAPKTKDPKVIETLRKRLAEDDYRYRAVTCLALGLTRDKKVGKSLLHCLTDDDPYVRLCAYRALRQITGNDYFADWLYGSPVAWVQAQRQYQQCLGV